MMRLGYVVKVNKEEQTLEDVYVLVGTPFGILEIPVAEYMMFACDSLAEALEVMIESAEAFAETQSQCDFEIKMAV